MDIRLLEFFGAVETPENFERIMRKIAKMDFLFPEADSIKKYDIAATYNYRDNAAIPVDVAGTLALTKSANTTDYTLTLTGELPKLTAGAITGVFGTESLMTNATVLMIEVPTSDYTKITVTKGSGLTLAANDIVEVNNRFYYILIVGAYSNTGTITPDAATVTITYNKNSVKYAVVVSGATLEA